MAHPLPQSKEQQANVSNANTPADSPSLQPRPWAGPPPQRAPLAWALWPHDLAPISARGARLWPQVLRAWPPALRAALLMAPGADPRLLAGWAKLLHDRGLVPALGVAPDLCTPAWLGQLPQVPLLVVLQGAADTPATAWAAAIAALARHRQPLHRWSALAAPLCHLPPGDLPAGRGFIGDVALAAPRGAQRRPLLPPCLTCALAAQCPGPAGDPQQLRPQPQAVTNQFDLLLAGEGPAVASLLEGGVDHPLALLPGQIDAAEVEIALHRQQIYRDLSSEARIGDFAAELQLLSPGADGHWRAVQEPPFAGEERLLMAQLQRLCLLGGDRPALVVDIGAGPVRYISALAKAVDQGQLRYIAVEPDLDHLHRSAAAFPQGQFVRGVAEHLPLADHCADAAMMLRSWNHLRDPALALDQLARVLRPGGLLLLVDNVVFGLVRDRQQLERAHALPLEQTPFEHFRNHDAPEAWALLQVHWGGAMRLLELHAVGPGSSNQWLLLVQLDHRPAAEGLRPTQ